MLSLRHFRPRALARAAAPRQSRARRGFASYKETGSRLGRGGAAAGKGAGWVLGVAALSGAAVGTSWNWTWPFTKREEEDEAKLQYWSCLGQPLEEALDLPTEWAEITFAPEMPAAITRNFPVRLRVDMNTYLRTIPLDQSTKYEIWSFNGGAPGPVIRAREGDILDLSFTNNDSSGMWHNIDMHCITGPGGGTPFTTCSKGETRSGTFKLLHPGLFIYHCAVHPVAHHIANGMYGVILVEPKEGLPKVDREYCVVQAEYYTKEEEEDADAPPETDPQLIGKRLVSLDEEALLDENPTHVVFNGRVGIHTSEEEWGRPLLANAGERVRLYFGNAGPNLASSFHVIGGIFDKVYREADVISPPGRSIQTTMVPAGGATIVELVPAVPGTLTLVDHSISRIDKGAVAFLDIAGPDCGNIFRSDAEPRQCQPCKIHP